MEFQKPCKVRRVKVCCGEFFGSSEAIRHRNTPCAMLVCAILPVFAFFHAPAFGADGPTAKVAIREQERPAATVLPDGTPVELRITKKLSTADAKVGDLVEFEVAHDVKVGDLVVIPRRALASGAVTVVKPRRRPMRNAELRVDVRTVKSITGSEVAIRGTRVIVGNLKFDPDAVGIMLSPVIPFARGDEAFVSKGARFSAYVNGDTSFDSVQLRQNMSALDEKNSAALAAATGGKAEVHVYRHVPDVSGGKPTIYLDNGELAHMQGDRYFNILIEPGAHVFRTNKSEIRLECKAGEEYYLRVERRGLGMFSPPGAYLILMPGQQGEDEMYPLQPSDAKDIKDVSKLVTSEIRP
jgi:hypothetical protein